MTQISEEQYEVYYSRQTKFNRDIISTIYDMHAIV